MGSLQGGSWGQHSPSSKAIHGKRYLSCLYLVPSVCDVWSCSSHLETTRTSIHKLPRKAEQENGKNVSFCLHLIRWNYEFSFPFSFYLSEGDSDGSISQAANLSPKVCLAHQLSFFLTIKKKDNEMCTLRHPLFATFSQSVVLFLVGEQILRKAFTCIVSFNALMNPLRLILL